MSIKSYIQNHFSKSASIWKIINLIKSIKYVYYYLFYYKFNLISKKSSLTELHIEFVSFCNLRCAFCSLDHDKPKVRITPELLEQLFIELSSEKKFKSLKEIHLHNAGETLLHPNVKELLNIIGKYKTKALNNREKFPKVYLLTNGTPLNEKNALAIIKSGAIDFMRFSMDGGSPKRFEEIRIKAKWDLFKKNILHFHDLIKQYNSPIKTHIICLIDVEKELSTKWMDPEFTAILNLVDTYELRKPHDWAGSITVDGVETYKSVPFKLGCSMLINQMVFLPNGDITVCCADLNSKGVIGNINESSLIDIYNSKVRKEWLKLMYQNKKHKIDLCKNCESY